LIHRINPTRAAVARKTILPAVDSTVRIKQAEDKDALERQVSLFEVLIERSRRALLEEVMRLS
jgi:hypothetical protein